MSKSLAIILGVLLFISALIPVFFKIGKVPDVNWGNRYNLESKDPNGLWIMMEMLKERYGEENIIVDPTFNAIDYEDEEGQVLYLAISNRLLYSSSESYILEEFVNYYGHSVLLIASSITFEGASFNVNSSFVPSLEDSFVVTYPLDTFPMSTFKSFDGSFEKSNAFLKSKLHIETEDMDGESGILAPLFMANGDTSGYHVELGSNSFTFHGMPEMFKNSSSRQDFFLDHMNYVFSSLDVEKVVLTLPTNENFAKQSPIAVLLKNPSLKAAYYFLLFSLATLLFFATKRRQPRVKTYEGLENTSLESAQSMSRLHEVFGSNEGFIDVLEKNFYSDVKSTFGLSENDPAFQDKMAKKSGVDVELMEKIIINIKRLKANCSDSQLIQLRNSIVKFNKKIEDG